MIFGALGDIHGDFESARGIMRRHPEAPFWLCVGDVGDDQGRYESLPAPLHFIKGNNDDIDAIDHLTDDPSLRHLHFVPNGAAIRIPPITIAGLGGTFAPKWFDTPAADLPAGKRDDKRRHFVREEVDACRSLRSIDVFLTHEAPRPFKVERPARPGATLGSHLDAGKTPINDVLAAMRPRLHLFGHHHRFTEATRQGVRSVGLDLAGRSYLLVEADTLEYTRLDT